MSEAVRRVLYVDDDEGLRRLVARSLARRGFDVSVAAGGAEGVALAGTGAFDLVAVDHYMPGQDGLQTLAEMMKLPAPPPVVYVTGSEESRIAVAALKAGAIDYVVKSVGEDFSDLLANAFEQALAKVELSRAKEQAEEDLRASNRQLEALLHEVNHRIANSLQLVSAFVHLQAGAVADQAAKSALRDTQRRITAIAQVHRRLYSSSDVETVDMSEYLAGLLVELEQTCSTPASPRKLVLSAEPIRLTIDRAVPVGIIVNELVTNACKYAYPEGVPGEVRVSLERVGDDRFRLSVEDDGCGLPGDGAVRGTGLGTRLVTTMAGGIKAQFSYDTGHEGVRATLTAAC